MGKRGTGVARRDSVGEAKKLTEFARSARLWIWLAATSITLGFAWLELRDTDLARLVESMGSTAVWKAALILYFASWVSGLNFDVDIQEEVLTSSANQHGREKGVAGFVAAVTIGGAVLVWAEGDIRRFSVALAIFSIADHAAGRFLGNYMQRPFERSGEDYRRDNDRFSLERLNVVRDMVYGPWKWWRLIVIVPLILLMLADAFLRPVSDALATGVRAVAPEVGGDAPAMVGGLLALAFVLGSELWIWRKRLNARVAVAVLDDLESRYKLQSIGSKAVPPANAGVEAS